MSEWLIISAVSAHRPKLYLFNISIVSSRHQWTACRCLLKYHAALLRKSLHIFKCNTAGECLSVMWVTHIWMTPATSISLLSIRSPHRIRADARDIECVHVCAWEHVMWGHVGPFLKQPLPFVHIPDKTSSHPRNIAQPACLCNTISPSVAMHSHPSAPLTLISLRHMTCEIAFYTRQRITNV